VKLNKENLFGAFNFNHRSWARRAIGSKEKPKSHLGILKEEKDQKRIHSFHERLRERARETFSIFRRRGQQQEGSIPKAKKGTDFEEYTAFNTGRTTAFMTAV